MTDILINLVLGAIIAKFGDFRLAPEERAAAAAAGFNSVEIANAEAVMNVVGPSFIRRKLKAKK